MKQKHTNETHGMTHMDLTDVNIRVSEGTVRCGTLTTICDAPETNISLREHWSLSTHHACTITAMGDSMVDAGINEGDTLIIDPCCIPQNGDIVVARVDCEQTVKYLYHDPATHETLLIPANDAYLPIVIDDERTVAILGVIKRVEHGVKRMSSYDLKHYISHRKDSHSLDVYIARTYQRGYMTEDGRWTDKATKEFVALWVKYVSEKLGVEDQWSWAYEKWDLDNLRKSYHNLVNSNRFETIDEIVKHIVA